VFSQPGVNPETGEPNRGSAAIVSVEPATGAVRTMVGGPGFDGYKYNLVTQNARGVGSSFKTFVLATIMEQGYSPDDIINGVAPCNFANRYEEGGVYDVNNFADGSGGVGTITAATLQSSNCAFVRLGMIAGLDKVQNMAYRLGIQPNPNEGQDPNVAPKVCPSCQSTPLGVASITPLEMASAYATLANDGVYNAPYMIERVEDRAGAVIYAHTPAPEQRVSPQTARLVNSILVQNVQSGTGTRARISGQVAAGKTGTNQNATDAWFVGYTPALSTAVWVGGLAWNYEIRLQGTGITGGRFAAPVWGAFMNAWQQGRPSTSFPPPSPVPGGNILAVPGGVDLSPPPAPPAPPAPDPNAPPAPPPGAGPPGGPPGQGL
jgi:penicillin-binding protein 1A